MAKLRVTGFTRFLLMMIVVVPLAFAGASYYNGQDPIANVKSLFGMEESSSPTEEPIRDEPSSDNNSVKQLQEELENCKNANQALLNELKRLKQE